MKKFLNTLSKASIIILIAAVILNPTAFAATTSIIVKDTTTGKYYQYNYNDLVDSLMSGSSLFNDFSAKQTVAFVDSVAGNVDYKYVTDQFLKDKKNFNLNAITEKATIAQTVQLAGPVSAVTLDSNGKIVVEAPKPGSKVPQDSEVVDPPAPAPAKVDVAILHVLGPKVIIASLGTACTTINASQFTVKAADGSNIKVSSASLAAWDLNHKTVIVTLAEDIHCNQSYSLTGGTNSACFTVVSFETIKPTVKAAKATGHNKIQITFSEQIKIDGLKVDIAAKDGNKAPLAVNSINYVSADPTKVELTTAEQSASTIYSIVVEGAADFADNIMEKDDTHTFMSLTKPVSAGSDQADRFYVKFSGNINAADYKNAVASGNWNGHPFGIQYKGALQQYKDLKILDVYNKAPDTLMFVLDTDDDPGYDHPSIALTVGKEAGQLEVIDSSFEGTGTAGNFLKNGVSHTIIFPDDITGIAANSSDISFTMSDTTEPSVDLINGIYAVPSSITINASESVAQNIIETTANNTINAHFTIDGKAVRLYQSPESLTDEQKTDAQTHNEIIVRNLYVGKYNTNPQAADSRNIIYIEIDENFVLSAAEPHHIKITDLEDYAGNKNTQELDFNVSN